MIIDCIADLHAWKPDPLGGDLLIIAGDLTVNHSLHELDDFNDWVLQQDYEKKIVIAGNHDTFFSSGVFDASNPKDDSVLLDPCVEYLCDSGTEFEGFKI